MPIPAENHNIYIKNRYLALSGEAYGSRGLKKIAAHSDYYTGFVIAAGLAYLSKATGLNQQDVALLLGGAAGSVASGLTNNIVRQRIDEYFGNQGQTKAFDTKPTQHTPPTSSKDSATAMRVYSKTGQATMIYGLGTLQVAALSALVLNSDISPIYFGMLGASLAYTTSSLDFFATTRARFGRVLRKEWVIATKPPRLTESKSEKSMAWAVRGLAI